MAQHREPERARRERLTFLMDRALFAPPPGAVNKRAVRRIHQPNHGVVDAAREQNALVNIGSPIAQLGQFRDWRRGGRLAAEEDPDIAVYLARGIGVDCDPAKVKALAVDQRGDGRAAPGRREAPAVIAALDFPAVEAAIAQGNTAVRAYVA